jgi:PadR family transcriptional regulator AphA
MIGLAGGELERRAGGGGSVPTAMRRRTDELATGEWAVLALVAERPTHGFAVARELAPGGDVGRVWAMRRPLVYRTLDILAGLELTRVAGNQPSGSGPPRTLMEPTAAGTERVSRWLATPVEHVRDARSELMLKLLFLDRAGRDPATLLSAQHERLSVQERELAAALAAAEGFGRTLALWRLESTRALLRFTAAAGES